ncbi:MAG: N-acetylmuramic acid 6-phosphate etherase [Phycisphaerales bacterium]
MSKPAARRSTSKPARTVPASTLAVPDRSWVLTEQRNPRSRRLHALSLNACVNLIQREDARVFAAVREAAARRSLARFIAAAAKGFVAQPPAGVDAARHPGRLIYVGAGTSGRLGVLDASEAPPTFQVPHGRIVGIIAGGDRSLRFSSEGREDEPDGALADLRALRLTGRDAVLGIAAGGTTPYVLGALAIAKRLTGGSKGGCVTGLLTCSPVPRPRDVDHLIVLRTGPEVLTGSTRMKAGTATKLALNTISTTLMARSGRVYQNLMVDLRASNAKLRDRAARIISTITGLGRPRAFLLLDEAGGWAKLAVVMHHQAEGRAAAERVLAAADGRLDVAMAKVEARRAKGKRPG